MKNIFVAFGIFMSRVKVFLHFFVGAPEFLFCHVLQQL